MTSNVFFDCVLYFFAISGFLFVLCDIFEYFTGKSSLPSYFCVIIPSERISPCPRKFLENISERLCKNNPDSVIDIIIADDGKDGALTREFEYIAKTSENIFIASTAEISEYIKNDF